MTCQAIGPKRLAHGAMVRPVGSGSTLRLALALLHLMQAWRERARLRRDLPTIDARMLRDIGLTRAELEHEAEKPIWRL